LECEEGDEAVGAGNPSAKRFRRPESPTRDFQSPNNPPPFRRWYLSLLDEGSLVASGRGGIAADKRLAMRIRVALRTNPPIRMRPRKGSLESELDSYQ